ncbi:UNVERIFIED_CONTAM: hypothetical protein GTU68_053903, partial [Idotea baltica]|nr:hypothetical protein [Idotea baltica]
LSDEHNRKIAGCYGHPYVKTPNIDALAARGTRFNSAYCNSPICVPSRASLATGRYAHEIGCWDNGIPYTGSPNSWHQDLQDTGVDVVSVGKLHYRGGDDYGFSEELVPLHVVGGKGDLKSLLRKSPSENTGTSEMARSAGPGQSTYFNYDTKIAATAQDWIAQRAAGENERPFVLFVSFVMPHFPLRVRQDYYDLYKDLSLDELTYRLKSPDSEHPALHHLMRHMNYNDHFDDESKAAALRAYFGMVTRLDELIGNVIGSLETHGYGETTSVIYTSDHGDNMGNRSMWGKSNMYDDSVGVPMIVAGPGIPQDNVVETPVSLVDIAPTAFAATG